jgi:hypothetical protein
MLICPSCKIPAPKGSQIVEGNVTITNDIVSNSKPNKEPTVRRMAFDYGDGTTTLICANCGVESELKDPSYETVLQRK